MLPKVLTPRFGDDALPEFFQVELKKHFELVPHDAYEKCPEKYDKEIVVIFPWPGPWFGVELQKNCWVKISVHPPIFFTNLYSTRTLFRPFSIIFRDKQKMRIKNENKTCGVTMWS